MIVNYIGLGTANILIKNPFQEQVLNSKSCEVENALETNLGSDVIRYSPSQISCISLVFPPFSDRFQVNANLLLETEEVRQNISKLNKEVWSILDPTL